MNPWLDTTVFLACFYAFLKFIRKTFRTKELIFAGISVSCLAISIYFIASPLNVLVNRLPDLSFDVVQMIREWSAIVSISFILSAIAILIRNAKPPFARFPIYFTALPLLLIAVHPIAIKTIVLKYWLMGIYQGGAIIIGIMLYTVMATHDSKFLIILFSVISFGLSFISYWLIPETNTIVEQLWKLPFTLGIIISVYGYDKLEKAYLSFETIESKQTEHI